MKLGSRSVFVATALLAFAAGASAEPAAKKEAKAAEAKPAQKTDPATMTVDDIRACMRDNLVDRGSLRELNVKATDREGQTHEIKMKLFWKPGKDGLARMNLRVLEPKDLHGSSYLLLEKPKGEEVFFFLPANHTVLKVTGNEMTRPLWGTDFSYTEIKQVQGLLLDGLTKRIADANVGDKPTFVLETATRQETTGYKKVVSYVDQASCTLVKSEFFAKGSKPKKVLEADLSTLMKVDTYWLVLGYKMTNTAEGSHTDLTLGDLFLMEKNTEKMFDPEQFYQVAE
ncbi:MAG TPA: outer membrane lipoprotein-sorting protein [Nevskiaceae bacterium]|nr:outer membrane lipoprotein-sorting protein [Nevskiaceae bacterium]